MCGNGIRCVARHLAERRGLQGAIAIETDAGPKKCTVHRSPSGAVEAISVEMGPAQWQREETFTVEGERIPTERVSMGNPHAVAFSDATRERAMRLGPKISEAVPGGVNVGFAQVRAGGLDLIVWERGSGLTEACGTGACAAAVAAVKTGRLPPGPIELRVLGGTLLVTVDRNLVDVVMRGPAERVFQGTTDV
jgi:diaminopimelate epimerase